MPLPWWSSRTTKATSAVWVCLVDQVLRHADDHFLLLLLQHRQDHHLFGIIDHHKGLKPVVVHVGALEMNRRYMESFDRE